MSFLKIYLMLLTDTLSIINVSISCFKTSTRFLSFFIFYRNVTDFRLRVYPKIFNMYHPDNPTAGRKISFNRCIKVTMNL